MVSLVHRNIWCKLDRTSSDLTIHSEVGKRGVRIGRLLFIPLYTFCTLNTAPNYDYTRLNGPENAVRDAAWYHMEQNIVLSRYEKYPLPASGVQIKNTLGF